MLLSYITLFQLYFVDKKSEIYLQGKMVKPDVSKRLSYLLTKTKAYDDVEDEPTNKKNCKTRHKLVKEMLQRWMVQHEGRCISTIGAGWKTFLLKKGCCTKMSMTISHELDPSTFKFSPIM
jgi:hypothetical protein